ncbi:hypothetical protein OROMI_000577 [Orobanche minor]
MTNDRSRAEPGGAGRPRAEPGGQCCAAGAGDRIAGDRIAGDPVCEPVRATLLAGDPACDPVRAILLAGDRIAAGAGDPCCGRSWTSAGGCGRSCAGGSGRSGAGPGELVLSWAIAGGAGRSRPSSAPRRAIAAVFLAVQGGRGRFLTVGDQVRSTATVF